jgi:hypothetical protein
MFKPTQEQFDHLAKLAEESYRKIFGRRKFRYESLKKGLQEVEGYLLSTGWNLLEAFIQEANNESDETCKIFQKETFKVALKDNPSSLDEMSCAANVALVLVSYAEGRSKYELQNQLGWPIRFFKPGPPEIMEYLNKVGVKFELIDRPVPDLPPSHLHLLRTS